MSKAALIHILDRWRGSQESDLDSSLLARFLASRDEDAFAALVRRHGPLVYGTCRRILGTGGETEDAFQAVFFVLARRACTLKLDRSIGPWLYGVALRVAKKLRGQTVQRRLREMAAAKSEQVEATEPQDEFWAILDEELTRLASPLREVVLLCDLSGQSHAQAGKSLGLAKGTVTKRLAKAHEELRRRLKQRGITLGAGALSALLATQASASVPASLWQKTARQAVAFSIGHVTGSTMAKTLAQDVMRSLKFGVVKMWFVVGLVGLTLTGGGLMLAGGLQEPGVKNREPPRTTTGAQPDAAKPNTMWKENYTVEYRDSLPVSVAFSADGKTLLTGDTSGEVMALEFVTDDPQYRWKSNVGGSHAAVAYSADQMNVYVTTANGVRILDAAKGREVARIEAPDSNPVSIGVFPSQRIAEGITQSQIVFGNARGYFVKSWVEGKLADTIGTIETSTVAKDAMPADLAAVPLAVDPKGRSAIMTGPRDPKTNRNVLWAYVCGNYEKGSPGNRPMEGHTTTVVSAAWAKEGSTAVTGDADGRVIVWDATTMKEPRRIEFGGRVMALAMSSDGRHMAAYIRSKRGGEVYVWETAKPADGMKPIHTQQGDFDSEPYASLTFSQDGKRLAGCAIDKKWLQLDPKTRQSGKVSVWELAPEPKAQPAPKLLYTKQLRKGNSSSFVLVNNHLMLTAATKEGAIDFWDLRNGQMQSRLVIGKLAIGRMKLSLDRRWLAMEQRPITDGKDTGNAAKTFEVGVYEANLRLAATIPSCSQLLDVAFGGKVVAVVRDKQIELWDLATAKKWKAAPFEHTRIDAAQFSPDGKLLAISDCNALVLWRWEENTHERIDLGRRIGSLTFTPDGKFLAEGPAPGDSVQVRDVETRKVVQSFANGTKQSMNVPRIVYTQGSRVLIACDNIHSAKNVAVPHSITFWDTANGSLAHEIALPVGLPYGIDVTPNGRYLAAMLDDGETGMKLSVWRLDDEKPVTEPGPLPPASNQQR
jgi:RNA polymerase sigma factor (sigma-70 family)